MKRPDLLLLVAIWAFLSAFFYLIGIVPIAIFALPDTHGGGIVALSIGMFIFLCFGALCLAAGIGILKAKSWGRILGIVVAVLSLLWFPIGTVIGILVLIYLARSEVRAYFEGSQ